MVSCTTQMRPATPHCRHLAPLGRAFRARAGLEAPGLEDGAAAALERARDSSSPAIRADYLSKWVTPALVTTTCTDNSR